MSGLSYVILIFSLITGFGGGVLLVYKNYILGYSFLALYLLIAFIVLYIKNKNAYDLLFKMVFSILLFPFFPFIYLLQHQKLKTLYEPLEFESGNLREIYHATFSSLDLAPFNTVLKYGEPEQRKFAVRTVYNSVKNENIDFLDGLKLLNSAIKMDENPDVVLYASDAISNLENFLIEKISYYSENLNSLEDYIEFGKYSYYYANSGFLAEEQKFEILRQSAAALRAAMKIFPESPRLILYLLKTLESLEEFDELENILRDKIENFKAQEILEYAIFYFIKRRKRETVRKLISDFLDSGFTPKSEALKFMLSSKMKNKK